MFLGLLLKNIDFNEVHVGYFVVPGRFRVSLPDSGELKPLRIMLSETAST